MKLKELIKGLPCKRLENISDCEIKGISCNSNSIHPGYIFVAIEGAKFDGHYFLNQAIDRGAKAIIMQKDLPLKAKAAKILVSDSQAALACVCASFFAHPAKKLRTIGITGTNGKTTVSYLIEQILACAGRPCGLIGTINYRVGGKVYPAVNTTPQADTLQSLLQEIVLAKSKYAIMEVSSHALAQRRVETINFSSAIFTNLTNEHLDYHGSIANYFACKASLFEKLNTHAWAIINVDDPYGRKLLKKVKSSTLTFGIDEAAQIRAESLKLDIEKSRFRVVTPQGKIAVESSLIGKHNVYNILAAISAALIEKVDPAHIVSGIKQNFAVPGRLERVDCGQNFLTFVDYAHTQDALRNTLQTLRQAGKGRIVCVFGCGGDRDKTKRPQMGRVASELSDFVIVTSDNPRSEDPRGIISDVLRGMDKKAGNYKVILDRFQAIQDALTNACKNDIILIAGKGHESEQIFADKTTFFNDRAVIEEILKKMADQRCLPLGKY